jgi:hypothetical protein
MTEAEWLACGQLSVLLQFAQRTLHRKVLRRKHRLFACACCRALWPRLADPRSREAVEVGERFADGQATETERDGAWGAARVAASKIQDLPAREAAWAAVETCFYGNDTIRAADVAGGALVAIRVLLDMGPFRLDIAAQWKECLDTARTGVCGLLRDFFGPLPFRSVAVDPLWLSWRGGTVLRLAEAIYRERPFADLPILADALEEAGCADADLLAHCRGGGDHVRGCWAVDLLLGKG